MEAVLSPSGLREGSRKGILEESFVPFDAASDSGVCGVVDGVPKSMASPGRVGTPSCEEAIEYYVTSDQVRYGILLVWSCSGDFGGGDRTL